jgi:membrane fusion protein, heavy metal efflux system
MFPYSKIKNFALIALLFSAVACGTKTSEPAKEAEEHHDEKGTVELTEAQFKAAQIMVSSFERKNLSEVITTNGYTKLPPQNQADVSVFMGGIVKTIAVMEGQAVKAGQTLATFQSLEYNNVRLQKAKLEEELKTANINRDYLNVEYARQKELSDENVNAKKVFQKVASDLELENSKMSTIQRQIDILDQNLALVGNSTSTTIAVTAPISGYITAVNIKIGSNIMPNNVLFSIVDNTKMHVDLLVYEKDLFKVKQGQKVRFILTNQSNKEILGTIFSIGKAFQNETKSVAVHADIENKNASLIPGMYVNALIDVGNNDVNTLPVDAIVKAEGKEFIFIQEADEHDGKSEQSKEHIHKEGEKKAAHTADEGVHFKRIEVKTGVAQLGFIQVTPLQELPLGAKIVVKGVYYLQSSIANAEGGDEHGH